MKLVNCTIGEKSQTWCQKILLPVLGLWTQLFSMVRLEEFAPRLRREDWGRVCGPVCCRRCLPTPSSACADSDVTPSFLVTLSGFPHHLGFPPPGLASPHGGPSLRHQEKGVPPLHLEPFLWETNLCLLLLPTPCLCQCPSASIFPESMKVGP